MAEPYDGIAKVAGTAWADKVTKRLDAIKAKNQNPMRAALILRGIKATLPTLDSSCVAVIDTNTAQAERDAETWHK